MAFYDEIARKIRESRKYAYDAYNMIHNLELTKELTEKDLEHKTGAELFQNMMAEVGEFCDAVNIEDEVWPKRVVPKELDESSKEEAVDMIITACAMYFSRGGTVEHLVPYMNKKLNKWERKQQNV